jgi:hypothetical protein
MAFGTLKADTLTHSTAGSLDTNYVVEGSAKVRSRIDTYTPTSTPSFNVSSLTDNGTGDATVNFTNGFDGTDSYHPSGFTASSNFIANQVTRAIAAATAYPASSIRVYSMNDAGNPADTYSGSLTIHGDLA